MMSVALTRYGAGAGEGGERKIFFPAVWNATEEEEEELVIDCSRFFLSSFHCCYSSLRGGGVGVGCTGLKDPFLPYYLHALPTQGVSKKKPHQGTKLHDVASQSQHNFALFLTETPGFPSSFSLSVGAE